MGIKQYRFLVFHFREDEFMRKNANNGQIIMPRKFVVNDLDTDKGIFLLFYSFLNRYMAYDGCFFGSIQGICKKLGTSFDGKKNRHTPKLAKELVECLDYMLLMEMMTLKSGDFHDIYDVFEIQLSEELLNTEKDYICITYAQFDYVFEKAGKERKANEFELLYWILGCSTRMSDGQIINACSYSIKYMCEKFHSTEMSIYTYLSKLCGEKSSNAPLLRYRISTRKIKESFKAFSSIYVKNDSNADRNFKAQYEYIRTNFMRPEVKSIEPKDDIFEEFPDY